MATEIKFCGLTRAEDAAFAASLGPSYVGVIFAGGPRSLTAARAADVLAPIPGTIARVGVFGDQSADEIGRSADVLCLDVVQLHGEMSGDRIAAVRRSFEGRVWAVCRVSGSTIPAQLADVMQTADAVLLDAYVPGALGGTGVALPWDEIAAALRGVRDAARPLILAGGLRPENVAAAIAAMAPDVVDVSSGVERAPGIKDHDRMRAFRDAVEAGGQR